MLHDIVTYVYAGFHRDPKSKWIDLINHRRLFYFDGADPGVIIYSETEITVRFSIRGVPHDYARQSFHISSVWFSFQVTLHNVQIKWFDMTVCPGINNNGSDVLNSFFFPQGWKSLSCLHLIDGRIIFFEVTCGSKYHIVHFIQLMIRPTTAHFSAWDCISNRYVYLLHVSHSQCRFHV